MCIIVQTYILTCMYIINLYYINSIHMDKDSILKDLHYDKSSVAYLASAKTIHNTVKQNGHTGFTLKYINNWLSKQVNQILTNKRNVYYPPIVATGPMIINVI